jgi:exosome complex RNA-binding protein Csl4
LYAFCSRCSTLLEQNRYEMQCPKCKNIEKRKLSSDYGKEKV